MVIFVALLTAWAVTLVLRHFIVLGLFTLIFSATCMLFQLKREERGAGLPDSHKRGGEKE